MGSKGRKTGRGDEQKPGQDSKFSPTNNPVTSPNFDQRWYRKERIAFSLEWWDNHEELSCTISDDVTALAQCLKDFSTRTWEEIENDKSRCHVLTEKSLERWVAKRLQEINLDEYLTSLFSVRLAGKIRIVGVRQDKVLKVIWWDENHTVAPSKLKNT